MGARSKTETVVAVLQAFLQQRVWRQADLARSIDIAVPALRKHLNELQRSGFPLEKEEDHPHVYWQVPKDWFPGAVLFDSASVPDLLRQLCRLPRSAARDRLVKRILAAAPRPSIRPPEPQAVLTAERSESEEAYLPVAEDSAIRKVSLQLKYFTASRGALEWRHASVQRVVIGPPARLIAVCHREGSLKWFRLDNVISAHLDPTVPYQDATAERVDAWLTESLDGFHEATAPVQCAFFVREPDCRWVKNNLPGAMTMESVTGGMRFTTTTTALWRVARYVVGLGSAARVETPELSWRVAELARGALEAAPIPSDEGG